MHRRLVAFVGLPDIHRYIYVLRYSVEAPEVVIKKAVYVVLEEPVDQTAESRSWHVAVCSFH